MIRIALLVVGLLSAPLALAQYRCVENGKTLFTDKPCASDVAPAVPTGNSPKVIGDTANSAYSTGYGDWRGQVQYQASINGQPISEAHSIVQTTLSIDPQGKITGSSPENGCRMKGIASPGPMPTILSLDITLTGCHYSSLNRRLSGTLALFPAQKQTQFWIYAHPVNLLKPDQSYDIKGTLRR